VVSGRNLPCPKYIMPVVSGRNLPCPSLEEEGSLRAVWNGGERAPLLKISNSKTTRLHDC